MKMTSALVALFLFLSINSSAQTKLIAHKSHSGSDKNFSITGSGNFGLPADYKEKMKKSRKTDTATTSIDTLLKTGADTVQKAVISTPLKKTKKKAVNKS